MEIAIYIPLAIAPGISPHMARGPRKRPKRMGVRITRAPGAIIFLREALVEILTH
jgi:hypothetical protein